MKTSFSILTFGALLATTCHYHVTAFEPNKPVIRKEQGRPLQGAMIEHDHYYNKASITGIHPSLLPKLRTKDQDDSQSAAMTCREYWFDQRIHSLGNTGPTGALHAAMAIGVTKLIDFVAYDGVNVRKQVCGRLAEMVPDQAKIVDLCCGVGTSTRELYANFPKAQSIIGVDTSAEMVSMADFMVGHISSAKQLMRSKFDPRMWFGSQPSRVEETEKQLRFKQVNAEQTELPEASYDLVTIMYGFHEIPLEGREKIVAESNRLLQKGALLAVIDITTDYEPSPSMLAGEPYVLEYQRNIHNQLGNAKGFRLKSYENLVPGHVGMWLLEKV
ncbi:hypothetical protein FisN_9Hh363 [Fistulifera solaris]|uniref:Uncharacterized protein n=1 Tax=Fistulifera solaris TaxID=1519565 RepID=A0A1Z5KCS7_FISSO|nr:hypothetical protein FisN_9Hh363 [Fistulifera solaris]|eukprot:GAX24110.1 hypothetical protein FisN_9Hh363 [Fistulifera solaris]